MEQHKGGHMRKAGSTSAAVLARAPLGPTCQAEPAPG